MGAARRIVLFRAGGCWNARFEGQPDVVAAFGTDTLPTAYTDRADGVKVLAHIAALNLDCEVSLSPMQREA